MRTSIGKWLVACFVLSVSSFAQDAAKLPVGTIVNFGPDLQTIAGGVCRQPEGIALDPVTCISLRILTPPPPWATCACSIPKEA